MKIILIGTSPAMLIEAILLRNEYKTAQIEIHEKNNLTGGSWKTTTFSKIKFIETGSHIFAPWKSRNLYKQCSNILRNKFKLKLYFLKPQPLNILNKNISKSELKKINYYYVQGGAGKILKSLIEIIKKKKIKIFYNSLIKRITTLDKKKKIITNKNNYFVEEVYIPYYCNINLNFFKEKKKYTLKKSIHILIKLSSNYSFKNKISYVQKVNFSKLFDRLSYLSNMSKLKDHIFCLRLSELAKKNFKKDKKKIIEKIKKDLIKFLDLKFQKKDDFKAQYKLIKYETSFRNENQLKQLKFFAKKNKIKLVDTSELIKYMSKNISRLNALPKL
jgi:hypothetical protein